MSNIKVEKNVSEEKLEKMGVFDWSIWEKDISEFPWSYDQKEVCYFLEGQVEVTTDDGDTVKMGKDDLVTLPQGMECTWKVKKPVKKHFKLGE